MSKAPTESDLSQIPAQTSTNAQPVYTHMTYSPGYVPMTPMTPMTPMQGAGASQFTVPFPPFQPSQLPFQREFFPVSSCWSMAFTCTTSTLVLDFDQLHVITDTCCCCQNIARVNYSDINTVDVNQCCCFSSLTIPKIGSLSPGCGCDNHTVRRLQTAIHEKIKGRGVVGMLDRLIIIETKLDALVGMLARMQATPAQYGIVPRL